MTSSTASETSRYSEALERALGRIVADARAQVNLLRERADAIVAAAEARAAAAETRLAAIEARIADRLAELKDGAPGRDGLDGKDGADGRDGQDGINGKDGADGRDGVDGVDGRNGADGAPGRDGLDVTDIEVRQTGALIEIGFTVGETRSVFEVELPAGPPGQDGKDGQPGERGPVGTLPAIQAWTDRVHYVGEVRAHLGGTWQALRDTAKQPPHEDWICLAAPGEDGASVNPCGLWRADRVYRRLDVVALNGGSFIARQDDPGVCPGDGWWLLVSPGKRGAPGDKGERGEKGERGPAGPTVVGLAVDDQGLQTLTNADGSTLGCDFYPVLRKLG